MINNCLPLNQNNFELLDLKSRIDSFLFIGIDLPTDDLLKVIISKSFSDKQMDIIQKLSNILLKMLKDLMKKSSNF